MVCSRLGAGGGEGGSQPGKASSTMPVAFSFDSLNIYTAALFRRYIAVFNFLLAEDAAACRGLSLIKKKRQNAGVEDACFPNGLRFERIYYCHGLSSIIIIIYCGSDSDGRVNVLLMVARTSVSLHRNSYDTPLLVHEKFGTPKSCPIMWGWQSILPERLDSLAPHKKVESRREAGGSPSTGVRITFRRADKP